VSAAEGTNVALVRSAYDAFNRQGQEAILAYLDPAIEWDESELPARQPGIYQGHEGVRRLLRENATLWDDISVAVDEVLQCRDGSVVAFIRVTGRGRNTGVDVELATAQVWVIEGGKAVRVRLYLDRQEAIDAAGGLA
jgi:ketosteroid isomerase-like protein